MGHSAAASGIKQLYRIPHGMIWAVKINDSIAKRPQWNAWLQCLRERYNAWAGYRKYGLLRDDLVVDTEPLIKDALSRCTHEQLHARAFRHYRAVELHLRHEVLPPELQTKPAEDIPYVKQHIYQIVRERIELDRLNKMGVSSDLTMTRQ